MRAGDLPFIAIHSDNLVLADRDTADVECGGNFVAKINEDRPVPRSSGAAAAAESDGCLCTRGLWFPLTVEIAGLTEAEGGDARNRLVDASLLRILNRDRQRFQLHALLWEELRNLGPLVEL